MVWDDETEDGEAGRIGGFAMAILGIGTDIVEIERIEKSLSNPRFLQKCFTLQEIEYCKNKGVSASKSFAGYFAAKESVAKALGSGFKGFLPRDIEVCHNALGRPFVKFSEKVNFCETNKIFISISHEDRYATALAIIEE